SKIQRGEARQAGNEGEMAAEGPQVFGVGGGGKNDKEREAAPADRQPPLHPSHERVLRLVGRMPAHDRGRQPILILVSETNSYGGNARFNGAGPCPMRPDGS